MISRLEYITASCIEVAQPIGSFYIASIGWSDIIEITFADVRRIEKERRDIETYLGIQRPLSPTRVKEISQYVNMVDSSFPTAIILAIDSVSEVDGKEVKNVFFDKAKRTIKIRRDQKIAKVIDGQHRIEGLREFKQTGKAFDLNVTIFVDMDIEDQAMVFATINQAQTKVNKSLVYDLYDFAHSRSPQKTCHNIAKLLNEKAGSPFKDKIKILGVADDAAKETITQATFVESLIKYISKDPLVDRDRLKRKGSLQRVEGEQLRRLFFRNMFIDQKDAEIAKVIWNYFVAVQSRWPKAWDTIATGNILNRSTGFIALMRFLKDSYLSVGKIGQVVQEDEFEDIFSRIELKDNSFTPEAYKPGSSGQGELYNALVSLSKIGG